MNHCEIRSWEGWHRHILFVFIAHLFIAKLRIAFSATPPKSDGIPFSEKSLSVDAYLEVYNQLSNNEEISNCKIHSKPKVDKARKAIIKKIKAIEGYVLCSAIALGLLQIISLKLGSSINLRKIRFLRTYSSYYASEPTIRELFRNQIFMLFAKPDQFSIIEIIKSKQKNNFLLEETEVSDEAA